MNQGQRPRLALIGLVLLAFIVRLGSALILPSIAHADEIYQNVEQAYRLLTGHGLVPWEFDYGIRSWIFPGTLAMAIRLAWSLGLGDSGALILVRVLMVAASLPAVVCAYYWGRGSRWPCAGLLAGGLAALWPDIAYFSSHTLSEVAATDLLVPAVFLADRAARAPTRRVLIVPAALLLACAAVLRVQLAPAALLAWFWMIRPDWRTRLLPALHGGAVPVLFAAIIDWVTLGEPLQSLWLYAAVNWVYGAAATWGKLPWYWYLAKFDSMWGGATPFLLLLALVAAPRLRLVAATVAAVTLTHMLVGHKEWRFIYPAIPFIVILAGTGAAGLAGTIVAGFRAQGRGPAFSNPLLAPAAAGAVLLLTVASLYISREYIGLFVSRTGMPALAREVARLPDVCGIGVWGIDWWELPGEMALGHRVPVYYPQSEADFASRAAGFDVLIYASNHPPPTGDWDTRSCRTLHGQMPEFTPHATQPADRICIAVRRIACTALPPLPPPMPVPKQLAARQHD